MNQNPLVSVVIPAYNCERYIAETLDSVINQTYRNLEIIVVNDCSKDNTELIVLQYLNKDSRIRYIKNEINCGVAKTRNNGVAEAQGEWIALVDSDDLWLPMKLQEQLVFIEEMEGILCCTGRELINTESESLNKLISPPLIIRYEDLLKTNSIVCSSVLCNADIMKEFPMTYDDAHEDYLVWLHITKKYGDAYGINKPLVKYRVSLKSKSGNKLNSLKMQYKSYLYLNFGIVKSIFYLFHYSINGITKYGSK